MPCHLCLSFGTYSHYDHRLLHQRLPRLRCQKKTPALHQFKQNGSIFVTDCHELKEKLNAAIRKNQQAPPLAAEMTWHLNPSLVPRSDGTWERLIQTPNKTLLLILGSRNLTLELFHTLLAETELMLNSRPLILTALGTLTPNHLLLHRPYANFPPGVFHDSSNQLTQKSWKETKQFVNHICKRLKNEYVQTQHQRFKWNQKLPPITVGELARVLLNFTPLRIWPIARVQAVYPGRYGQTRVCFGPTPYATFEPPPFRFSAFSPRHSWVESILRHFSVLFFVPAAWEAGACL